MKKKILSIITVFCILAGMTAFVPAYALEKSGDFEYQVTDNKVIIRGYSDTGSGVVEVPATIAGMPVVEIGQQAFYNNKNITGVTVPEGVVNIGHSAFCKSVNLTTVNLPETLKTIGENAFKDCTNLLNIKIPENVETIGESAFSDCESLTSIVIPDGVLSIGDKAFYNCDNLNSIVLPKSLSTIGKEAFDKSNNLKTVYYKGSEADWNNVVIGEDNAPLAKATIIFNYTGEEDSASTPSSWAEEGVNAAKAIGIIIKSVMENYQANITREQFCEMVVKAYEYISGKTADAGDVKFSDTDNDQIKKAANLGIVSGYGDGIFAPNDLVTREQIAAMLVRMISKAVDNIDVNVYNDNVFSDKADISDWALASINFAYDNGIMQGVGENRIDSKSNTTCEQAVLLVYRTVQKYSK
ncbi:MAG: leucine-rich repeat protein [Clostridia bacterium]|nr:leucine-rich repeat protein [Clostridia bacterium]